MAAPVMPPGEDYGPGAVTQQPNDVLRVPFGPFSRYRLLLWRQE